MRKGKGKGSPKSTPEGTHSLPWQWYLEISLALILTVVGSVMEDLRWLLWLSWVLLLHPIWAMCKQLSLREWARKAIAIFIAALSLYGFSHFYTYLDPVLTPAQTEERVRNWLHKAGYSIQSTTYGKDEYFHFHVKLDGNRGAFSVKQLKANESVISVRTILGGTDRFEKWLSEMSQSQLEDLQMEVEIELRRFDVKYCVAKDSRTICLGHDFHMDRKTDQTQFLEHIYLIERAGETVELKTHAHVKKLGLDS